ncbi:MAG: DsrE family protein [Spirochaetota bacterium]
MSSKQITYIVTHADDDPEMASIPFVLANTAVAMDVTPVIILQGKAVMLAMKGYAEHIHFEGFNPLMDMIKSYIEAGNKLLVCTPCMNKRKIKVEDLIEGAEAIGGAKVNEIVLESDAVLTY